MSRKVFSKVIVVMLVTMLLLTGCNADKGSNATDGTEPPESKFKVALLLDGNINDGGWNQSPYEGLMRAADELGIEASYTEKIPTNEFSAVMRDYANRGYNLIIGNGYPFTDALVEVSEEYPDVMFVGTNQPSAGPNLMSARLVFGPDGYLAGTLAGDMTKTKKIGAIYATESAHVDTEIDNMRAHLQEIDPEIELFDVYTGDWVDVTKAKQAASALVDDGCDIIVNSINGATSAIAQLAVERGGFYVIGWTGDEAHINPDVILGSFLNMNDILVYYAIKECMDGNYAPGTAFHFGLEEGAVGPGEFGKAVPKETVDKINAQVEDIISGKITIDTEVEGWL